MFSVKTEWCSTLSSETGMWGFFADLFPQPTNKTFNFENEKHKNGLRRINNYLKDLLTTEIDVPEAYAYDLQRKNSKQIIKKVLSSNSIKQHKDNLLDSSMTNCFYNICSARICAPWRDVYMDVMKLCAVVSMYVHCLTKVIFWI